MSSHDAVDDPRNEHVLVYLNDRLVPRKDAVVSVLDAGFLLGDGLWESFRVRNGKPLFVERHLDRLFEGLKSLDLDPGRTRDQLRNALTETLQANGMVRAHVRLMLTRGPKRTPYQGRSVDLGRPTLVILAEHKDPAPRERGLRLVTVHVRRGAPDVQDPGWNSHSKLNCVTAAIQAEKLGADEALMLDPHGFVATCNSTHFFVVRAGTVLTSTPKYCLEGITRGHVLELCRAHGIPCAETDFSLRKVYAADEAFCTGTFGGLVPVEEVDGRRIGEGARPVTARLTALYEALQRADCGE
jgi:branched-chain amino acid aminotransferase